MKQLPQWSRTNPTLPESLNHHLSLNALAAGAAGVSLLSLSQPAEAEIIFTPTHVVMGYGSTYYLDLNNDGIGDFFFQGYGDGHTWEILRMDGLIIRNRLEGGRSCGSSTGSTSCTYARALNRGAKIPGQHLMPFARIVFAGRRGSSYYSKGPWVNVQDRYLGLLFIVNREIHYGWARMTVRVQGVSIKALLTGYAYETIPSQRIRAGQIAEDLDTSNATTSDPGSLGALAQGSQGLQKWRRQAPAQRGGQPATNSEP